MVASLHVESICVLKLAYFGLAQTMLTYGLSSWSNSLHMIKVFITPKRIISTLQEFVQTLACINNYLTTLNIKKIKRNTRK